MLLFVAHVDYVTDPDASTDPIGFLLDALAQPGSVLVLLAGAAILLGLLLAWARWRPREDARVRFVERAAGYHEYVPWMVRLSAGLVLIGSGLSRTLIMPTIDASGIGSLVLTVAGFLLLLGFAVRLAALAAIGAYVVTTLAHPELVMMLDVVGALAITLIIGPGRPSLDDLLRAAFPRGPGAKVATENLASGGFDDVVPLLARLGLGGAFVASGIADKLLIHDQALAAVEQYGLTAVVPVAPELWVVGAALVETGLGLAIVFGAMTRLSAAVGFGVLTAALFALPDDPVIAHVALFGLSSVLVILGGGRWSLDRTVLGPLGKRWRRSDQSTKTGVAS